MTLDSIKAELKQLGIKMEDSTAIVTDSRYDMRIKVDVLSVNFPCPSNVVHELILTAYLQGLSEGAENKMAAIRNELGL